MRPLELALAVLLFFSKGHGASKIYLAYFPKWVSIFSNSGDVQRTANLAGLGLFPVVAERPWRYCDSKQKKVSVSQEMAAEIDCTEGIQLMHPFPTHYPTRVGS